MSRRMASSGKLRRVALVRTDVSEEPGASFIRVTRIGELGTTQAATSNRRTLRRNSKYSSQRTSVASYSETSVFTRATRSNIQEDTILHSHRRENLKSYIYEQSSANIYYHCECIMLLIFSLKIEATDIC
jgi:hypothetical protein